MSIVARVVLASDQRGLQAGGSRSAHGKAGSPTQKKSGFRSDALVLYASSEPSNRSTAPPAAVSTACAAPVSHSDVGPSLG